jgi:hypothetical protein
VNDFKNSILSGEWDLVESVLNSFHLSEHDYQAYIHSN